MAAIGVGTLYDVAINGVGFRLQPRGWQKRPAPTFVPRFSTGEQGSTDLQLYKQFQQNDFSGGGFQVAFDPKQPNRVLSAKNFCYRASDKYLNPTETQAATTGLPAGFVIRDFQTYRGDLYCCGNASGGTVGGVYVFGYPSGIWTASKINFTSIATNMCVLNNKLWVCIGAAGVSQGFWSYDGTTTTTVWTVTASPFNVRLAVPFRSAIYTAGANDSLTGGDLGHMQKHNGVVGTGTVADIGAVGDEREPINTMMVFNQRLMIGKPDGLYGFDGVTTATVLDFTDNPSPLNFKNMEVFNGALYFSINTRLYRFTGSSVELVNTFNYPIDCLQQAFDTLLVCGQNSAGSSADAYMYDGTGFFCTDTGAIGVSPAGFSHNIGVLAGSYADSTYQAIVWDNGFGSVPAFRSPFGGSYTGVFKVGVLTTGEYDAGYFHINKFLSSITIDWDSQSATDSMLVEARTHDGKSWSAYSTFGTLLGNATTNRLLATSTAAFRSNTWKRIQLRFSYTKANYSVGFWRGFSAGYYLSPEYVRQWTLNLDTSGQSNAPLLLRDNNTNETKKPTALREALYSAMESVPPVGFEDVDFSNLTATLLVGTTASALIANTDTWPSAGFVKINDEIIQYAGKTQTSITSLTRGVLGTTAAQHTYSAAPTPGPLVSIYYRVVVTQVPNELMISPSSDDGGYGNETTTSVVLQEAGL